MKTLSRTLPITLAAILATFGAVPAAHALSATQTVLKEVRTTAADGSVSTELVEAVLVVPGETVVYRLDYTNDSEEPVEDMVLTMPVPAEIEYQAGSAEREGVRTVFSSDGGGSFGAMGTLSVESEDGTVRPAEAGDVTHVRWIFETSLPAGGTGDIAFSGTLR